MKRASRRLFAPASAALLVGWAWVAAYQDLGAADLRDAAERIETGPARDLAYFEKVEALLGLTLDAAPCSASLPGASVTLRLARLDATFQSGASERLDSALQDASKTLTSGLGCEPLNGKFWLSLARAEQTSLGFVDAVHDKVRLSFWTGPASVDDLKGRVGFLARIAASGVSDVEDMVASDGAKLAALARPLDFARLFLSLPNAGKRLVQAEWTSLGLERRIELAQSLLALGEWDDR